MLQQFSARSRATSKGGVWNWGKGGFFVVVVVIMMRELFVVLSGQGPKRPNVLQWQEGANGRPIWNKTHLHW